MTRQPLHLLLFPLPLHDSLRLQQHQVVNTDDVLIAAELITTILTKEIGTMTKTILDLDEEMGKTFLPTPTMLSKFDE
ncbi:hypothetical protein V6N13_149056 [Hibiscus sabdariffa]|uniref:Uncharacterized protein n=1 Tax=Hibiscus sabdariffa TaxID=183260 RepID=A0ABR2EIH3_9ROSI